MTTATSIRALLRKRYQHPEWALMFEVANGTGHHGKSYADAVAMNLYPSRGLSILGFEIKVSKQDFMREIEKPDKSVPVQQFCDQWWLVAPAKAVDESLLPKAWGWLRADDDRLVQVKAAPDLEAKSLSRPFIAALVRRQNAADASEVDKLVRDQVEMHRKNDREHIERAIKNRTQQAEEAIQTLAKLKERIGTDRWDYLDADEIAQAVKFVRKSGVLGSFSGVESVRNSLRAALKSIDEAMAPIDVEKVVKEAAE